MLAGFPDGRVDEGPAAGEASLLGLRIAEERGWSAPRGEQDDPTGNGAAPAPAVPEEKDERPQAARETDDQHAEAAAVEAEDPADETAAEKKEAK